MASLDPRPLGLWIRYKIPPCRYPKFLSVGTMEAALGCFFLFIQIVRKAPPDRYMLASDLFLFIGAAFYFSAYWFITVAITPDGIVKTAPFRRTKFLPVNEWKAVRIWAAPTAKSSSREVIVESASGSIRFGSDIANFKELVSGIIELGPHLVSEADVTLVGGTVPNLTARV